MFVNDINQRRDLKEIRIILKWIKRETGDIKVCGQLLKQCIKGCL